MKEFLKSFESAVWQDAVDFIDWNKEETEVSFLFPFSSPQYMLVICIDGTWKKEERKDGG